MVSGQCTGRAEAAERQGPPGKRVEISPPRHVAWPQAYEVRSMELGGIRPTADGIRTQRTVSGRAEAVGQISNPFMCWGVSETCGEEPCVCKKRTKVKIKLADGLMPRAA
jgi:hypothetical protein